MCLTGTKGTLYCTVLHYPILHYALQLYIFPPVVVTGSNLLHDCAAVDGVILFIRVLLNCCIRTCRLCTIAKDKR